MNRRMDEIKIEGHEMMKGVSQFQTEAFYEMPRHKVLKKEEGKENRALPRWDRHQI